MKNNPLVQVIIPIYNTGHLIERCVNSIITQTYDNIFIICINDGSKDNTKNALLEIQEKVGKNKIAIINKENGGAASARNVGLKYASEEGYILFVDSDDWIGKDTIIKMVSKIEDADLLVPGNDDIKNDISSILTSQIQTSTSPGTVKKLIKATLAKSFSFDESLYVGEDTTYFVKLYLSSKLIKIIRWDDVAYYIGGSMNSSSLTRNPNQKLIFDNFYKWFLTYEIVKNKNLDNRYYNVLFEELAKSFLNMYALYNYSYKIDLFEKSLLFVIKMKIVKNYNPSCFKEKIKRFLFLYFRTFFRLLYSKKRQLYP